MKVAVITIVNLSSMFPFVFTNNLSRHQQSGIPYMDVLYRSSFVGRSFIESDQNIRTRTVRRKFTLFSEKFVKGKRVVLVDDSLVRGTTIEPIAEMLKAAGATEVGLSFFNITFSV